MKLAGTSLYDLPKQQAAQAQQQLQPQPSDAQPAPQRFLSLGGLAAAGQKLSSVLSGNSQVQQSPHDHYLIAAVSWACDASGACAVGGRSAT